MAGNSIQSKFIHSILKKIFAVEENPSKNLGDVKKILVIRQHNQLGDMLAGISLFRALKEKYPNSHLSIIVSPNNKAAIIKNKFVDSHFVFDKPQVFTPFRFIKFIKFLRQPFDVVIVPVTVSVSFTSNLIARISNSKIRIGANSLNGKPNDSAFFFDRRVDIDWRRHPDSNVSDIILDLVRPFGINTNDLSSNIKFDQSDLLTAKNFLQQINYNSGLKLIGLHVGAGKPQNRWSLQKYVDLIFDLNENYNCCFYVTGWKFDSAELEYINVHSKIKIHQYLHHSIPQVAALVSISNLFITNDTGIMHVAGTTATPQISLFGPTNPFNWAPCGKNKIFLHKSDLIDDIEVEDVFNVCKVLLGK
ncbi:MAG: glycosyltransferase family 9 protein [Ignavibacteriota bacterium]